MNSAPNTVFRQLSEKVLFDVLAFASETELESLKRISPDVSRIVDLVRGESYEFTYSHLVYLMISFLSCSC